MSLERLKELNQQTIISRALYALCYHDVPRRMDSNSCTVLELAQTAHLDASILQKLFDYLVLFGIFAYTPDGNIIHTEVSVYLSVNHPQSYHTMILHNDEVRWNALGHLHKTLKTGDAAFDDLYGCSYYDYLATHQDFKKRFDQVMDLISQDENKVICEKITLHGVVADIGGGSGPLLRILISQQSAITEGLLFDLPETLVGLDDVPKNMTCVPGSFFEPLHMRADFYMLKRVIHNWDDAHATRILKNVSAHAPEEALFYLFEYVKDPQNPSMLSYGWDLFLSTVMTFNLRTQERFESIANAAGLELCRVEPIREGGLSLIIFKK